MRLQQWRQIDAIVLTLLKICYRNTKKKRLFVKVSFFRFPVSGLRRLSCFRLPRVEERAWRPPAWQLRSSRAWRS